MALPLRATLGRAHAGLELALPELVHPRLLEERGFDLLACDGVPETRAPPRRPEDALDLDVVLLAAPCEEIPQGVGGRGHRLFHRGRPAALRRGAGGRRVRRRAETRASQEQGHEAHHLPSLDLCSCEIFR